jgi:hypothetical protein
MELTTLRTDARFLVSPQLTSSDYGDTELDRNINRWYRTAIGWIIPVQGDWEVNGDIMYRDVQEGVTEYELPTQLLRIYKGEIMYTTNGEFVPLEFISVQKDQLAVEGNSSRVRDDVTRPTCELFGDIAEIKPAGSETVVNGIKFWIQTSFQELDTSNDVPQLLEPVQELLSVGAAYDYAQAEEMWKKAAELKKRIFGDPSVRDDLGLKGMIEDLYTNRSGARRHRLSVKKKNFK